MNKEKFRFVVDKQTNIYSITTKYINQCAFLSSITFRYMSLLKTNKDNT